MRKDYSVRRAVAIFMLALVFTAITGCRRTPSAAEYDVFSAFIDAKFPGQNGVKPVGPTGEGITRIVIREKSNSDGIQMDGNGRPIAWAFTARSLQAKAPALEPSTLDAFRTANQQQTSFRRSFHIAIDYELVDKAQLDSVFRNGGWPAYYQRYPGSQSILAFSRVGLNEDGTQALFYLSHKCGGICGGGEYVVMEKRDDRWAIEKEIVMWMS